MMAGDPTNPTRTAALGSAVLRHEQSDFDCGFAGVEWCIGHMASSPRAHVHSTPADACDASRQSATGDAVRPMIWQQKQKAVAERSMRRRPVISC
jgi:hypothetical protein